MIFSFLVFSCQMTSTKQYLPLSYKFYIECVSWHITMRSEILELDSLAFLQVFIRSIRVRPYLLTKEEAGMDRRSKTFSIFPILLCPTSLLTSFQSTFWISFPYFLYSVGLSIIYFCIHSWASMLIRFSNDLGKVDGFSLPNYLIATATTCVVGHYNTSLIAGACIIDCWVKSLLNVMFQTISYHLKYFWSIFP